MSDSIAVQTHYRTCNLCEAMCGLEIQHQNGQVLSIKGDKNDPFSHGHICPKATALQDIYEDPDRLKYPVRRTADGWERIPWDEAYDAVVAGLKGVQEKYGTTAVGVYLGNPNAHKHGSLLFGPPFIRALRTTNRFSATSADQLPHQFAALFMFGHQLLLPIPDIDRTDYMLILGANPLASNGSLMTAPDFRGRLKAIQKRGGKFVVIDPRRTETAALANQHFFIKPGTDVLLLLALVQTIFAENLVKLGRLLEHLTGLKEVEQAVAPYTPEKVAAVTGLAADEIRQLARDFCAAERAVCYGRIGTSTQAFGGVCNWLINVLNIITGNFDRAGGAMFTLPAFDVVGITGAFGSVGSYNRWQSRVRQLPEFSGELPVSALAEDILTPGEGQIKAMVTVAGNPVLSTPNGRQLDEALASLEFMVAIDIYINETTRHADIILPTTTGLEEGHYDLAFHYLAVRNTTKYSEPLFEPDEDQRHDWEIYRELRQRLEAGTNREARQDHFKRMRPDQILDLAMRVGPYGLNGDKTAAAEQEGESLKLRTVRKYPHGIDLGPLRENMLPKRLFTPDKKINLAPELILNDLSRVNETLLTSAACLNGYDLALIGRRDLRSNNSWMHNSQRLVKGKERCTLLMNPDDAAARDIVDGQTVTVKSRVGALQVTAEVSAEMMRGVVSIPHGWGHGREGVQLTVAQAHAGVSINDLTDDQLLDELTGNAAFNGVPVEVLPR